MTDGKLTNRHHHHDRNPNTGRYRKTPPCDSCGKPVGTDNWSDPQVCGGTDGPGFFLCDRKRCLALPGRASEDVAVRRAHYVHVRATADACVAFWGPTPASWWMDYLHGKHGG